MGFLKLIVQVFFVCFELSWVGGEGWGPMDPRSGGSKDGGSKGGGSKGGGSKGGGFEGWGPNPEKVISPEGWGPKISRFFFLQRWCCCYFACSLCSAPVCPQLM